MLIADEMINMDYRFLLYCEEISHITTKSILTHNYLFRWFINNFLTIKFDKLDEINIRQIIYLDRKQRKTRFPRVALQKDIADKDILYDGYLKHILNRVNSKAKTYYINPFYSFYLDINESYYQTLKRNVEILKNEAYLDRLDSEPHKKCIWLAIQFDNELKKSALPYAPIILDKEMVYGSLEKERHILEFINILEISNSLLLSLNKKIPARNYLKKKYRKIFSYRNLKIISHYKERNIVPLNIYKMTLILLNECFENQIINRPKYQELLAAFDTNYILMLANIHNYRSYSFVGYQLEKRRNQNIEHLDNFDTTNCFNFVR